MPEPGLLIARLSLLKISPFLIAQLATIDLRAMFMFLLSLLLGVFIPEPSASLMILVDAI